MTHVKNPSEIPSGDIMIQNMAWLRTRPVKQARIYILIAAAVSLFFELAVIRWHASAFQLLSYYKNISLMSVFLGLGVGYSLVNLRRSLAIWVIPGLILQWLMFHLALTYMPWLLGRNLVLEDHAMGMTQSIDLPHWIGVMSFLVIVFTASALSAVPLGQLCGVLMGRLNRLEAYGWNLVGSLLGILLFIGLSYLWTGPEIWFLVLAVCLCPMLAMPRISGLLTLLSGVALISLLGYFEPEDGINYFSPYQNVYLSITHSNPVAILRVSHFYYQKVLDLSSRAVAQFPEMKTAAHYYNYPYELKPHPQRVLIVGAGTGNDVAAAVRNGAGEVDAVEIDPLIYKMGHGLHPERPYDNERAIHVHIDDARAFVRKAAQSAIKYDLIVYGLLDSHTMLSSFSSVRQDSFVYTVEGLRESRKLLAPDGVMSLSFAAYDFTLAKKMYGLVKTAFDDQEPLALETEYDAGTMFLAGPGLAHLASAQIPLKDITELIRSYPLIVDIPTDDWPFPYLALKSVPTSYIVMIFILSLVSFGLIWLISPAGSRAQLNWVNTRFFFLGAGFLLIETRAMTELGLLFGNTWIVVAAVISGVLLVAFCSNLAVLKGLEFPRIVSVGLLCVCLLVGWMWLSSIHSPGMAVLLTTLPLFFAGQIFSAELKVAPSLGEAFTANLFGSICGGFFEYLSLKYGVRFLYLDAMAVYLLVGALSLPLFLNLQKKQHSLSISNS